MAVVGEDSRQNRMEAAMEAAAMKQQQANEQAQPDVDEAESDMKTGTTASRTTKSAAWRPWRTHGSLGSSDDDDTPASASQQQQQQAQQQQQEQQSSRKKWHSLVSDLADQPAAPQCTDSSAETAASEGSDRTDVAGLDELQGKPDGDPRDEAVAPALETPATDAGADDGAGVQGAASAGAVNGSAITADASSGKSAPPDAAAVAGSDGDSDVDIAPAASPDVAVEAGDEAAQNPVEAAAAVISEEANEVPLGDDTPHVTEVPATEPQSVAAEVPAAEPQSVAAEVPAAEPQSVAAEVPAAEPQPSAAEVPEAEPQPGTKASAAPLAQAAQEGPAVPAHVMEESAMVVAELRAALQDMSQQLADATAAQQELKQQVQDQALELQEQQALKQQLQEQAQELAAAKAQAETNMVLQQTVQLQREQLALAQEQSAAMQATVRAIEALSGSSKRTESILSETLAVMSAQREVVNGLSVGDRVRLCPEVEEPDYGWDVSEAKGCVGRLRKIDETDGSCLVEFVPGRPQWCRHDEVEPVQL